VLGSIPQTGRDHPVVVLLPVVGISRIAALGSLLDDRVQPVVVGGHGADEEFRVEYLSTVGLHERAQPVQSPTASSVCNKGVTAHW